MRLLSIIVNKKANSVIFPRRKVLHANFNRQSDRMLGYKPFPKPKSLSEYMLALRRTKGWPIRKAAHELGVNEGTWGAWERGETILFRIHWELVARFLGLSVEEINREMGYR